MSALGLALGLPFSRPARGGFVDPLAEFSLLTRLQTHNGDGVILGLYTDTACTTPATADGDLIAGWRDELSVFNLVATQSNSMMRPTLRIIGGMPMLEFDGVDDNLMFTGILSNTIATIFTAQQSNEITQYRAIVDDANVQCYVGQNNTGQGIIIDSLGAIRTGAALNTNAEVWTAYYETLGDMHLRQNGVDTNLVAGVGFGSNSQLQIGRAGNGSAAWSGYISAVLASAVTFSAPEIITAETYLATLQ